MQEDQLKKFEGTAEFLGMRCATLEVQTTELQQQSEQVGVQWAERVFGQRSGGADEGAAAAVRAGERSG